MFLDCVLSSIRGHNIRLLPLRVLPVSGLHSHVALVTSHGAQGDVVRSSLFSSAMTASMEVDNMRKRVGTESKSNRPVNIS